MDIGKISVLIGLAASIASIVLYILSLRNRKVIGAARAAYALTAFCAVFCFGRLMWLFYHQRYEFKAVFEHSSPDLRFPWNIAATWASQEGSFLLWMFWTAIIGGLVAWKAGKWEARVMPIYTTVMTFLFSILAWLSPYALLTKLDVKGYPSDLPWPPNFGMGLHPSLQNYWMAIHPPTIFFGFASLAVPFSYAIAAMLWREYGGPKDPPGAGWAPRVMPYVLMTIATLGVGLFMGGYWAYETQGWHGFWGWDPVENASLFPWICGLGLLHGLVVQKSRGGMGRTNIFMAVLAWMAFLWGTYLTRSGVLSEFSVHSFVSLASQPLDLLKWMLGLYGAAGLVLIIWRWKDIPSRPVSDKALSRDTAMIVAVSLMIFGAVIIAIATSWPMLSRLTIVKYIPILSKFYNPTGMVTQPSFYNTFGSILIIPTLIVMGIVPFIAWGKTNGEKFLWKVLGPWLTAVLCGFGVVYFVLTEASSGVNPKFPETQGFNPDTPRMLVVAIATLGMFAAFSNIFIASKVLRTKAKITMGGWLAHVGIGMIILGTVLTNVYEKTDQKLLIEGESPVKTAFGYTLQYVGWTHDQKLKQIEEATDEKTRIQLRQELNQDWHKFDHAVKFRIGNLNGGSDVAHADDAGATPSAASDSNSFLAEARVFVNNQKVGNNPNEANFMRWPYIHKEPFRDFYVSISNDPEQQFPSASLAPDETKPLVYHYGGAGVLPTRYAVHYKRFYMEGTPGQAGTVMRAELEVIGPDGRTAIAKPGLKLGGPDGPEPVTYQIPELQGAVTLSGGIDASTKTINADFEFRDAGSRWIIPIQVTNKPMINMVWLGVIVMGLGTLCAMVRRAFEARKGALIQNTVTAGEADTSDSSAAAAVAKHGEDYSKTNAENIKPKSARAARAKS